MAVLRLLLAKVDICYLEMTTLYAMLVGTGALYQSVSEASIMGKSEDLNVTICSVLTFV